MHLLVDAVGFGIAAGAVIAIGAVGFSLQFGMSNVLNITYGALMTLAAYLGLFLLGRGLSAWAAMPLCAALVGLASAGIIVEYAIVAVAGTAAQSYGRQSGATLHLLGMTLTAGQVAIILIAAGLMLGLHLLLTRTTLGRAMRATAANPTLARSCGIATERVGDAAWLLSGGLCGAAGVALALTTVSFDFTLGSVFLIPMIAAAVLGGIGQPYGAMLGALVVGIASEVAGALWDPAYKDVVAFLILIVMLLVRPRGLFGAAWSARRLLA